MQSTMRASACYYSRWVNLVYELDIANTHKNSRPMQTWCPGLVSFSTSSLFINNFSL